VISTLAGLPRVSRIAKSLSTQGEVTVLEWDRSAKLPKNEMLNEIKHHRLHRKAGFGFRLFCWLPEWFLFVGRFGLKNRFDIIVPQNLDALLPIIALAKLKNTKIIYDVADFYADSYLPKRAAILRPITASIERLLIRMVDAVIVVDESRICQVGNVERKKISIVYNVPYDHQPSHFTDIDALLPEKTKSSFLIYYAGILSPGRGLYQLVDVMQQLSGVTFVVSGFGEEESKFVEYIRGKENVLYLGKLAYEQVLSLTRRSDCVIAIYDPSIPNNRFAAPNKVYEAMMCAKPSIVADETSIADIMIREHCGLVIPYNDSQKLKEAISTLVNNPKLAKELGSNGRKAFISKYNWSRMEKTLSSVVAKVHVQ
jgi:glycosyltransferase involved in cell wall biosynthesis